MLYVIFAILLFGALIFIHELGHYIFARIFGVTVYEFAIGMGPKLFSVKSKKTGIAYSLRLLPIGGFVSMAGEDEETDDPNSIGKKPLWQRIIITAAGSLSNILLGIIVMGIMVLSTSQLYSTTVAGFAAKGAVSNNYGLREGDRIIAIGPRSVHVPYDLSYAISRYGGEPVDVKIIRDGEKITLENVHFPTYTESGITLGQRDFYLEKAGKTFGNVIKHTFYESGVAVRMVYDSLYDLITGKYGFKDMSGPVGVTKVLANAAQTKDYGYIASLFVVLAMNLGIVNLLPLPALDGGRVFFMLVELVTRKKINPKTEGLIHFIGIILLLILMFAVTCKDIIYLVKK